jgi:dTDP-4-dehydrorhamnose reductase
VGKMRILVTGASGLLGFNLAYAARRSHTVIGADRGRLKHAPFQVLHQDLLEDGAVEILLNAAEPDMVIHCAAVADVDFCEHEPEIARRLNADIPAEFSAECARRQIRLLHVSTDAVFDGQSSRPYTEDDAPNPRGVYAETKLAGETEVLAHCPEAVIVRVNFYGWSPAGERSLAEFFVGRLAQGIRVKGFTDVIFCPMFVGDLGDALVRIAESRLQGLYHGVGVEPMTKYEFGLAVARRFDLDTNLISPASVEDANLSAPRAHCLNLSVEKLSRDLGLVLHDFSTGLNSFHEQSQQGYPQMIRTFLAEASSSGSESLWRSTGVANRGEGE